MYSQNDEEKYILEFLKNKPSGNFLDIGAYDGKTFSNTLALLERGWSGVAIEPSPTVFLRLQQNVKTFPVQLVNCAIGVESKIVKFQDAHGDAISSFDPAHVKKWEGSHNVHFSPHYIKTITIKEVFDTFGFNFQFINLDVEGANFALFKQLMSHMNNLSALKLICIEHDSHIAEILNGLESHGFKLVTSNGENIILGRN